MLDTLLAVPAIERVLVVAPADVDLPAYPDGRSASVPEPASGRAVVCPESLDRRVAPRPEHLDRRVGPRPEGLDRRVALLPERPEDGDGPIGLNPALARAQAAAVAAGATRLLIVPADLPLLRPADVAALLDASAALLAGQGVVIAPDRARLGTNALVLAPPAGLAPRFGVDSFRAHLTATVERRLPHAIVERPGLALDLDTPDDVARLLASPSSGRTVALARSLRLDERLEMAANR